MSRILLAWELGSNLGHLSRLLPLAQRLRRRGHAVLVAVRDLTLAARILGPAGIPFIQAPQFLTAPKLTGDIASYSDLLHYMGWADPTQLWGMVQAWTNALRLFAPSAVVLDHSPTALLSLRSMAIPCALIGTGFEIPPQERPLPAFPGYPGPAQSAVHAEELVLENANQVLKALQLPAVRGISDLFQVERRWLTTFPELDHYAARPAERYVGPISHGGQGESLQWPAGQADRVFAYLRPDTPDLQVILKALAASNAAVVCYAPGVASAVLDPLRSGRFLISGGPVDLKALLPHASLCVSYAPAGTVTGSLLHGVPQLLAPVHVESQLTALRVEGMGAGLTLTGGQSERGVASAMSSVLRTPQFKARATDFARRYQAFDADQTLEQMVDEIESMATRGVVSRPIERRA